ncbi:hypothetical protein [Streptomyces sp. NBC_01643]|uniref:hypothetical protein n=1 Tax=Streptomyces sp. NBC_01643 TaxID=2975906 RepID=UPI002F90F121|nr:hypothetical protein OHB03_49040 [Streptomyces sp. NBC_01643]
MTPRPRQPKLLYDLDPPGVFYKEWDHPVGTDADVMAKVGEYFGPESGEATTMQALLRYREIYGPHIPLGAAGQLDLILTESDWQPSSLRTRAAPRTRRTTRCTRFMRTECSSSPMTVACG